MDFDDYLSHFKAPRPARHWLPWRTEIVQEHEFAILTKNGVRIGLMSVGRHRLWGRHSTIHRLDRRRQHYDIPAQEFQLADGVTLRATALVVWSVADPLRLLDQTVNANAEIHAAGQSALRLVLGQRHIDVLASERARIGEEMLAHLRPALAPIGITVHEARLKDVMPGAEGRRALAAVAIARQEAAASLEKARAEQAALRALANAARLLQEHPGLAQLKAWQAVAELRGAQVVIQAETLGLRAAGP